MNLSRFLTIDEKNQITLLKKQMLDARTQKEVKYFEDQIHHILDRVETRSTQIVSKKTPVSVLLLT